MTSMPYCGELMLQCPRARFDFSRTYIVIVTGSTKYGHMLLNVGGRGGDYFHVVGVNAHVENAGLIAYPRWMNEQGYQRYLSESGKRELRRFRAVITEPNEAMLELERYMARRNLYLGRWLNCVTFVEAVIQAGGCLMDLHWSPSEN